MNEFLPNLAISGMSQNPNAFAFQLMVARHMFLPEDKIPNFSINPPSGLTKFWGLTFAILLGLALLYTGSRAAYLTVGVVLLLAVSLKWINFYRVLFITVAIIVVHHLPAIWPHISSSSSGMVSIQAVHESSDHQRMYTIEQGLALWSRYPIFGGGLGAYLAIQAQIGGPAIVIHHTTSASLRVI